jgi:hypothetical protein
MQGSEDYDYSPDRDSQGVNIEITLFLPGLSQRALSILVVKDPHL